MAPADPVIVVDYDSSWPTQFESLKERATQALVEFAPRIEHVGSTAVPGLAAKPIIDLIIQLDDTSPLAVVIRRLEELGYRHEGDLGIQGREAFAAPAGEARHHLYVCCPGCSQLPNQLAFRDYLRAHPIPREEYAALKRQLANKYRDDRVAYSDGKARFVANVLALLGADSRPNAIDSYESRSRVNVRLADLTDAPDVARVHVKAWLETYRGLVPDSMLAGHSVQSRTQAWKQILDPATAGTTMAYVAEVGAEIVAFGSCGAQRTDTLRERGYDGEISAIYVLHDHQGAGTGGRLMAAMASSLASRGYQGTGLWVLRNNARARRFYDLCAGKVVAERSDVRPDAVLEEVAYGWPDVSLLQDLPKHQN